MVRKGSKMILVVAQDADYRRSLVNLLREYGYRAQGKESYGELPEEPVDLVLLFVGEGDALLPDEKLLENAEVPWLKIATSFLSPLEITNTLRSGVIPSTSPKLLLAILTCILPPREQD